MDLCFFKKKCLRAITGRKLFAHRPTDPLFKAITISILKIEDICTIN